MAHVALATITGGLVAIAAVDVQLLATGVGQPVAALVTDAPCRSCSPLLLVEWPSARAAHRRLISCPSYATPRDGS
jgi:hypothetical protein